MDGMFAIGIAKDSPKCIRSLHGLPLHGQVWIGRGNSADQCPSSINCKFFVQFMSQCSLSPATFQMLQVGRIFENVALEKLSNSTPFSSMATGGAAPLISAMEYDESGTTLLAASDAADALFVFEAINNPELRSIHRISRTGIGLLRAGHHSSLLYHSTIRLEGK